MTDDAGNRRAQRAFLCQLGALSLTKLGDALVSSRLVLAWTLTAIGAPGVLIATLVPLRESLALLPQLFIAAHLRAIAVRKWYWVAGSLGQALALAGMVAVLLLLPGAAAGVSIVALLALFSLARGVCSVVSKDVLGKTVAKARRGRLTGLAATAAGLAALAVVGLLWALPALETGTGGVELYAALLATGAALWVLAALVYAAVPERAGTVQAGGGSVGDGLRSLAIIRSDHTFRHFLIARMLLVATAFSIPYIVVLLQRAGGSGFAGLAPLMIAEGTAALVSGAIWGLWSDRASHRVMAAAAGLGAAVIGACLWMNDAHQAWLGNYLIAGAILFIAAVAHHGARIGRSTYLVDMADDSNRLQYTAVSNTVMGVFLLAGMGLGVLDSLLGTASVLWLLLAVALGAALSCLRLPAVE